MTIEMIEARKHSHYFRSVAHLQEIDIYRVLELFGVTDQALGHAIKKLVVPGMRGGGKTGRKDIEEAIDTLQRRLEMMDEDAAVETAPPSPTLPLPPACATAGGKPWYPDDSGAWVEVPDDVVATPAELSADTEINVLVTAERRNRHYVNSAHRAGGMQWILRQGHAGRIVAYRQVPRV